MLLLTLPRPLVAPALVAPFAVLVAGVGAQVPLDPPVPMLVATLVLLGLGRVGVTVPSTPLWVSSLVAAAFGWLYVLGLGLDSAVADQTVAHLWGHGADLAAPGGRRGRRRGRARRGPGPRPHPGGVLRGSTRRHVRRRRPHARQLPDRATVSLLSCVLAWSVVVTIAPERLRPVGSPAPRRGSGPAGRRLPRPGRFRATRHAPRGCAVHPALRCPRRRVLALGLALASGSDHGHAGRGRMRRVRPVVAAATHDVGRRSRGQPRSSVP